jgi:predicted kinase
MKLKDLIFEADGKPKAVVMAGGGGAGKSTFLKQVDVTVPVLNPDKYVEGQDMHLAAASKMVEKEVQEMVSQGKSFIWDTTASNPAKVESLLQAGYDVMMVMVYTHPMISFLSNFERERKIPKIGVLSTWQGAYSLIETYRKMLGDNFHLVSNTRGGKYDKQIEAFNAAAQKGGQALSDFLDSLDVETKSTFSKEVEMSKEDAELFGSLLNQTDIPQDDEGGMKYLQRDFLKNPSLYEKQGFGRLEKRYEAYLRDKEKREQKYISTLDSIAATLQSPAIKGMEAEDTSSVAGKVQQFLS